MQVPGKANWKAKLARRGKYLRHATPATKYGKVCKSVEKFKKSVKLAKSDKNLSLKNIFISQKVFQAPIRKPDVNSSFVLNFEKVWKSL